MKDELKRFSEAVAADKALEAEVMALVEGLAPEEQVAKALEFANAKGFQITKEDLVDDGQKVDLEEMEKFAGGDTCACAVGGGGCDDMDCQCFLIGEGWYGFEDKASCVCAVGGGGQRD